MMSFQCLARVEYHDPQDHPIETSFSFSFFSPPFLDILPGRSARYAIHSEWPFVNCSVKSLFHVYVYGQL